MSTPRNRLAAASCATALLLAACGSGTDGAEVTETPAAETEETEEAEAEAEDAEATGSAVDPSAADWCEDPDVSSSITVGINNPNYATQMAVVLADERGYLADRGITDVEIIVSDEYIAGLIGGTLDITQGDTDVAFGSALASGEDLRFVGTYRGFEWRMIGVAEGIEGIEDLAGQPVTAGPLESRNATIMFDTLERLGLSEDELEPVPQGGGSDARLQALVQGTVKAASIFPRHRVPLEEAGGSILSEEFVETPQEGLIVMGDTLEDDCATIIAYLAAQLQARQDIHDLSQQDGILAIMRDRGFDIPDYFEAVYELEVDQISPDGGFDPGAMDVLVQEIIDVGNLPEDIDWRTYVDLRPLHAAQQQVGLELDPDGLD